MKQTISEKATPISFFSINIFFVQGSFGFANKATAASNLSLLFLVEKDHCAILDSMSVIKCLQHKKIKKKKQ